MTQLGGGMMFGGGLLSGLGSVVGGAATNRAGRKARDFYGRQTQAGANRLGSLVYGEGFSGSPNIDPIYQQMMGLIPRLGHGQAGILGQFDQATGGLNAAAGQALQRSELAGGRGDSIARGFNRGAESLIDLEYQNALANATGLAQGANRAGGFQSTASNQQIAGVGAPLMRGMLGAKLGARNATAQMRLGNLNQAAGRGAQLSNAQLGRQYQRSGARTGMQQGNLQRDLAQRQMPMNMALGIGQSNIMNPWLNQNTSQYYPGASGLGSALGGVGNAAAGFGAQQYGQAQQFQNTQKLLGQAGYPQ